MAVRRNINDNFMLSHALLDILQTSRVLYNWPRLCCMLAKKRDALAHMLLNHTFSNMLYNRNGGWVPQTTTALPKGT